MRSHSQRLVQATTGETHAFPTPLDRRTDSPDDDSRVGAGPDPLIPPIPLDAACNLDKSATLPAREHVDRALSRTAVDLGEIAELARLPVLLNRTRGAAIGIYQSLPAGTPLWLGRRQYLPN